MDDTKDFVAQRAKEMFYTCDTERKGYITKNEIERLNNLLPLSKEQLEAVFDSLDDDGNGQLTLSEFTDGFGQYLIGEAPQKKRRNSSIFGTDGANDDGSGPGLTLKFRDSMRSLSNSTVEQETASELYEKLKKENPDILPGFEKLLSKLASEIEDTRMNVRKIENTIAQQATEHEVKVQTVYSEMEAQIKNEEQKLLNEVRNKEKQIREELEQDLYEKDRHYNELLRKHEETKKRLHELSQQTGKTQQEIDALADDKEMLEEALEENEVNLEESQAVLDELRTKFNEDRRQRAATVDTVTKGISSEKDQLLAQLAKLREINKQLKDERDESLLVPEDGPEEPEIEGGNGETLHFADRPKINNYDEEDSKQNYGNQQPPDIRRMKFSEATEFFGETMSVYGVSSKYGETIDDVDDGIEVDEEPCQVSEVPMENRPFYRAASVNSSIRSIAPIKSTEVKEIQTETMEDEQPIVKKEEPVKINYQLQLTGNEIIESVFKVVLVGDANVGKTALLDRFCNGNFKGDYHHTVGVDFQLRSLIVESHSLALQIWDTAGQEKYEAISKQFYRKADGVVLVYDVMEKGSFLNLKKWMDNVESNTPDEVMLMVLGNKIDLTPNDGESANENQEKYIPTKQASELSREYGAIFFEVSALSGNNVNEAFATLARVLKSRQDQDLNESIKLTANTTKKGGCCSGRSKDRISKRNKAVDNCSANSTKADDKNENTQS